MPKGRPPTPSFLKLIKGTARRTRQNPKRTTAVSPAMMPEAPDFLSAEARQEWDHKCEMLFKAGIVALTDRAVLAAYAQSYGRWRQAEEVLARMAKEDETDRAGLLVRNTATGKTVENLMISIADRAMADCVKFAGELGLTPSSRTRISADPPHGFDPAEKYLT
jgi:P27 family predicted phage terminase small subunit